MKRKLLSCAVALFASASLFAQQDVTPSRYVFANQPVGAYSIDLASTGANPASGFAGAVENFNRTARPNPKRNKRKGMSTP